MKTMIRSLLWSRGQRNSLYFAASMDHLPFSSMGRRGMFSSVATDRGTRGKGKYENNPQIPRAGHRMGHYQNPKYTSQPTKKISPPRSVNHPSQELDHVRLIQTIITRLKAANGPLNFQTFSSQQAKMIDSELESICNSRSSTAVSAEEWLHLLDALYQHPTARAESYFYFPQVLRKIVNEAIHSKHYSKLEKVQIFHFVSYFALNWRSLQLLPEQYNKLSEFFDLVSIQSISPTFVDYRKFLECLKRFELDHTQLSPRQQQAILTQLLHYEREILALPQNNFFDLFEAFRGFNTIHIMSKPFIEVYFRFVTRWLDDTDNNTTNQVCLTHRMLPHLAMLRLNKPQLWEQVSDRLNSQISSLSIEETVETLNGLAALIGNYQQLPELLWQKIRIHVLHQLLPNHNINSFTSILSSLIQLKFQWHHLISSPSDQIQFYDSLMKSISKTDVKEHFKLHPTTFIDFMNQLVLFGIQWNDLSEAVQFDILKILPSICQSLPFSIAIATLKALSAMGFSWKDFPRSIRIDLSNGLSSKIRRRIGRGSHDEQYQFFDMMVKMKVKFNLLDKNLKECLSLLIQESLSIPSSTLSNSLDQKNGKNAWFIISIENFYQLLNIFNNDIDFEWQSYGNIRPTMMNILDHHFNNRRNIHPDDAKFIPKIIISMDLKGRSVPDHVKKAMENALEVYCTQCVVKKDEFLRMIQVLEKRNWDWKRVAVLVETHNKLMNAPQGIMEIGPFVKTDHLRIFA